MLSDEECEKIRGCSRYAVRIVDTWRNLVEFLFRFPVEERMSNNVKTDYQSIQGLVVPGTALSSSKDFFISPDWNWSLVQISQIKVNHLIWWAWKIIEPRYQEWLRRDHERRDHPSAALAPGDTRSRDGWGSGEGFRQQAIYGRVHSFIWTKKGLLRISRRLGS